MTPHPRVACVVVAAGVGSRLGAGVPKAFVLLSGRPLLAHAIAGIAGAWADDTTPTVDLLVVVAPPGRVDEAAEISADYWPEDRSVVVVPGGADRVASVRAGIAVLPTTVEVVLVHDAARCLTPPTVFTNVTEAVRAGGDAVVPGVPVVDTVKTIDTTTGPPWRVSSTPRRMSLRAVQTPQGFRRQVLDAAHRAAGDGPVDRYTAVTDDAGLVEAMGGRVSIIPGHTDGFKITTTQDLLNAECAVAARATAPVAR